MIYKIRSFLRNWNYCLGCMHLKLFKCFRHNIKKEMTCGCCNHKRKK